MKWKEQARNLIEKAEQDAQAGERFFYHPEGDFGVRRP
jgi:hypothetical protein